MYDFPKSQMRVRELVQAGFSETEILDAVHSPGQNFARKISPGKRNSPIVINTAEFGRYLEQKAGALAPARRRII